MIPSLAIMISAYTGFRMIEVFLLAESRYSSKDSRLGARLLAVVALIVIVVCALNIFTTGSNIPTPR